MPSGTPSESESAGQPLASTVAPAGVPGHLSSPSYTPSLSESVGQPRAPPVARNHRDGDARPVPGGAHARRAYALAHRTDRKGAAETNTGGAGVERTWCF